jgi:hypothetical protein
VWAVNSLVLVASQLRKEAISVGRRSAGIHTYCKPLSTPLHQAATACLHKCIACTRTVTRCDGSGQCITYEQCSNTWQNQVTMHDIIHRDNTSVFTTRLIQMILLWWSRVTTVARVSITSLVRCPQVSRKRTRPSSLHATAIARLTPAMFSFTFLYTDPRGYRSRAVIAHDESSDQLASIHWLRDG